MARKRHILRKIYFFRVSDAATVLPHFPTEFRHIENLPFNNNGRYLIDREEGDRLVAWVESDSFPLRIKFGRTRLGGLPTIEEGGRLEPLELTAGQGLNELTHIMVFADGTVAAEFNFDGPRLRRLGDYLFQKRASLLERPKFLPLFQRDVFKAVGNMQTVTVLELKGRPDAQYLLDQADQSVAEAFKACVSGGATKAVGLQLSADPMVSGRLKKIGLRLAKTAQRSAGEMRELMSKVAIKGTNVAGKPEWIDILEDQLIIVKQMEKISEKSKAISSASAFKNLASAYDAIKDELGHAIEGHTIG